MSYSDSEAYSDSEGYGDLIGLEANSNSDYESAYCHLCDEYYDPHSALEVCYVCSRECHCLHGRNGEWCASCYDRLDSLLEDEYNQELLAIEQESFRE